LEQTRKYQKPKSPLIPPKSKLQQLNLMLIDKKAVLELKVGFFFLASSQPQLEYKVTDFTLTSFIKSHR
jgi:hypothetical protein